MQVMDIKPAPKTNLEEWNYWKNHITSVLISQSPRSKKVKVVNQDEITCSGHGRTQCLAKGEHSWFNHAMDGYFNNPGASNLPKGFIEP